MTITDLKAALTKLILEEENEEILQALYTLLTRRNKET